MTDRSAFDSVHSGVTVASESGAPRRAVKAASDEIGLCVGNDLRRRPRNVETCKWPELPETIFEELGESSLADELSVDGTESMNEQLSDDICCRLRIVAGPVTECSVWDMFFGD